MCLSRKFTVSLKQCNKYVSLHANYLDLFKLRLVHRRFITRAVSDQLPLLQQDLGGPSARPRVLHGQLPGPVGRLAPELHAEEGVVAEAEEGEVELTALKDLGHGA